MSGTPEQANSMVEKANNHMVEANNLLDDPRKKCEEALDLFIGALLQIHVLQELRSDIAFTLEHDSAAKIEEARMHVAHSADKQSELGINLPTSPVHGMFEQTMTAISRIAGIQEGIVKTTEIASAGDADTFLYHKTMLQGAEAVVRTIHTLLEEAQAANGEAVLQANEFLENL